MDLLAMIAELREERDRLDDVILALERLARGTRPGRGRMSKAAAASASAGASKREKPISEPPSRSAEQPNP
jgi:hypothetical protein